MKNKGFTLIELLAVIVILAIIALIAVPIILNIIDDSRKESNERSIEMYAKGLENALAKHQLDGTKLEVSELKVKEGTQGREFTNTNLKVDYEGNVVCNTIEVYEDGKIYLADCEVNGKEVEYTYGTNLKPQEFKPQYYAYDNNGPIFVNGDLLEETKSTPEFKSYAKIISGLDLDRDNKVSKIYLCFEKNGKVFCLKGGDPSIYDINKNILVKEFGESACSSNDDNTSISCSDDRLEFIAKSDGTLRTDYLMDTGNYFTCTIEWQSNWHAEGEEWGASCGE